MLNDDNIVKAIAIIYQYQLSVLYRRILRLNLIVGLGVGPSLLI